MSHCVLVDQFTECFIVFRELHHRKYYEDSHSMLTSASTKELYKDYLRFETFVLIRILRLTEIDVFLSKNYAELIIQKDLAIIVKQKGAFRANAS